MESQAKTPSYLHRRTSSLRTLLGHKAVLKTAAALLAGACAMGSSANAMAYDSLAYPCKEGALRCQIAPLAFSYKDALPIEWSFDTGWTPPNSPVQVHLWAGVYANTHGSLKGALQTTWPETLVLATPGDPLGGSFGFHYGVEIGAQGKIEVEVAGKKYSWTGDLPFIPQFDFQVEADQSFDAWGFAPGVTVSGKTQQQTLAQIGIADIIGGSIPGIDGGFELDVAMELEATYQTKQIVLETTDGKPVKGGAIMSDTAETSVEYLSGPSIEIDVHPEGTVDYNGILHLIPAFFIELLGQSWSIPIADIPIEFPITESEWIFDKQRVHVPLPDLAIDTEEIDFGDVEVGQKNLEMVSLWSAGEAKIIGAVASSNSDVFEVFDPTFEIEPSVTFDTGIRFVPKKNGEFSATIYVGSNDPSHPVQLIQVRGRGYGGPGDLSAAPEQEAGCACRAAGEPRTSAKGQWAAPFFALGLSLFLARRKKQR